MDGIQEEKNRLLKKTGLIGFPLGHSFSPGFFEKKFKEEGMNEYVYELFPLEQIEELENLLEKEKELIGLNVTIPYKEAVIPYLHETDRVAREAGAVNCIKITTLQGKPYLKGFNTDVTGFRESFEPLLSYHHSKALIFGNGGAAAAVKFVLSQLDIPWLTISRKDPLYNYKFLDKNLLTEYTILINTTPVGMFPNTEESLPIPFQHIGEQHLFFDMVYNPAKTVFLAKAEQKGATIKNGLEMLEIQAEESWKIWNSI